MKKSLISLILLITLAGTSGPAVAQTSGTLTFSVTTTEPAGNYNGVNVIALWIEDTNGNFIKTKMRYADARIQYLNKWVSSSMYNVTDAVTGATRSNHGPLTMSWNATDVAGNVVADNGYRVCLQMSDKNAAGEYLYLPFVKDTNAQTLSFPDTLNFTSLSLTWSPVPAGVSEYSAALHFACSPNPVSGQAILRYTLPQASDVTITVHDVYGKSISVLADGNQPAGEHLLKWDQGKADLKPGVYFIKLNTGRGSALEKIMITR